MSLYSGNNTLTTGEKDNKVDILNKIYTDKDDPNCKLSMYFKDNKGIGDFENCQQRFL